MSSQIPPGLTTILLPTYELGQRAAEAVLHWLTTKEVPPSQCLPIEIVVRGTSAPPADIQKGEASRQQHVSA